MNTKKQSGFALITIMILFSFSLLIITGLLRSTTNNAKLQKVVNVNNDRYYDVEKELGSATAWFQENSKYIATLFKDDAYADSFDNTIPSEGDNDGINFKIPTQVKVAGTNNSVIISNNEGVDSAGNPIFGISSFPTGEHYDTGATKDLVADFQSEFPNADNGGVNVRIILVSGVGEEGSDRAPIFRIDAITGNNPDRGTHLYASMYGEYNGLNDSGTGSGTSYHTGFLGYNSLSVGGSSWCKSKPFVYNGSSWSPGVTASNCLMVSNGAISLSGSGTKIYGSAKSNSTISNTAKVSGNNADGCSGSSCHTASLNTYTNNWTTDGTCSSFPNVSVSSNRTLAPGCYGAITVENQKTLTLTEGKYYVKSLLMNGGKPKLQINPSAAAANYNHENYIPYTATENPYDVELFVETFTDGHINGKEVVNSNFAPHLFKIIYTGSSSITLNGTADMKAHLFAPNAHIGFVGNFEYYGGVNAKSISSSGTADLYSDDVAIMTGTTAPVLVGNDDVNFRITKVLQRYR